MAFLLKPLNGETRRMELSEIHDALKRGSITEQWMVRDERQDFWYSVAKLVGKVGSQPVMLFCPNCRTPIQARRIDIGLPATCPQCATAVIVPDPEAYALRQRDEHRLVAAKQKAIFSGIAFAGGLTFTVCSFLTRSQYGGWILWWGPLAFGAGTFIVCFPEYLELRKKLKKR